jgi:hypothetical protein
MLTVISFSSFFSFFMNKEALQCASCTFADERNENNEQRPLRESRLFSLISYNSFFSLFVSIQEYAENLARTHAFAGHCEACLCLASPGVKSEGQHTRCTHRVLPGLAGGAAPSTPEKAERQKP